MNRIWKFIIFIGIIAYFICIAIFEKSVVTNLTHAQMTIYFPWGFAAIFISLYIFYEYSRVTKAKRNERKNERNERNKELLDNILKANKKNEQD